MVYTKTHWTCINTFLNLLAFVVAQFIASLTLVERETVGWVEHMRNL